MKFTGRSVIVAAVAIVAVLGLVLVVWARAALSGDLVRSTLASQLSEKLGQPVSIATLDVHLLPRLTLTLGDVRIGANQEIGLRRLELGTDLRALLSRRIEHAFVRADGARLSLPLLPLSLGSGTPADSTASAPVTIGSIDEVSLTDVEILSGGRTLKGDIRVTPQGAGAVINEARLTLGETTLVVTGRIADFTGPAGELNVDAGSLNLENALTFFTEFAAGATPATTTPPPAAPLPDTALIAPEPPIAPAVAPMNVIVTLEADRATLGTLAMTVVSGTARVTREAVTLSPIKFGVLDGTYSGSLTLTLGNLPDFRIDAAVSNVDVATATTFAGSPGIISGKMSGQLHVSGRGTEAARLLDTLSGTARLDVRDGEIKGLGLVRTVILATSMRTDSVNAARGDGLQEREPFSRLGGNFTIAGRRAHSSDFQFESKDVTLTATGDVALDGTAIDLSGRVLLSEALSAQAGRDLVRYSQENGRVTFPLTITGSIEQIQVRLDLAEAAKRALTNRATEEAKDAIRRGLGGLLGR